MYFKKLELIGFKSFAEKTTLYFEPGITTIVGPNGCGKSNIIDAIKWALGEQSVKSLRGSKMDDVIFNGTDEKEPINMAEVSLTLSNKDKILPIDSTEIVISRKLFRLGESEYYINKAPVRLKDIAELFMGTGIGAEAYSIIEQGKIDLILSSRPDDRRFIFEEASGITKYKSKKKEAVRKLEATDNNLLRVNDIIIEVKRQINSITRQAQKAERYKERFDRLKELELILASYEYDLLKNQQHDLETRSDKVRDEAGTVALEIEKLQRQLEDKKKSLAEVDQKFGELQSGKFSRESLIGQSRNKIEVDKERIIELGKRIENLQQEIAFLDKRKEDSQKLLSELENKLSAITDSEESKKEFLGEKEKNLAKLESEITRSEKRIEESKQIAVDCMAEKSKSKNEVVRLASDIQNHSLRLRRLDIELEKTSAETAGLKKKLDETQREFKEAETRLNNIRSERERLAKEKGNLSSSLESIEEKLQHEKDKLIGLESKKSFLEDLIARHEGLEGGVKALLNSMEKGEIKLEGIRGILGNIIKVTKGYELAVEAALGDYIQCVASQDRKNALKAVEYLSDNKLGRATFVILDEFSNVEQGEDKAPHIDGILGRLSDFVIADAELKNTIGRLLKNVYLIRTLEAAEKIFNSISPDIAKDLTLVTTKGEIYRGGFITGGTNPKGEDAAIIGRETRLKEAIKQIELCRAGIEKMQSEKQNLQLQLTELGTKFNNIEDLLKEEELEYHKKESRLSSVEQENSKLKEEVSLLELEKDEVIEEIKELNLRKDGFEKRLEGIEAEENNTQNVLLNLQEAVKNFTKEREETIVLITRIKTEMQALSKEEDAISQNLNTQRESFEIYAKSLVQKSSEIEESSKKKDELAEEIEELQAEIIRLSAELKAVDKELAGIGENKNKDSSIIGEIEKNLAEFYKLSNSHKDSEHNFQLQKSEIKFKIETLRSRMSQLYKADIELNRHEYNPNCDWDAMRREIEELNRKLESMGTVNLVAIEEHKELEERFNFLSHQREDLTKAKEDLETAIAKINKTTRKLFLETFEKIQFEFKNYFRYLFGGGQAEVFLLDEHDVLESGIEIVVRPPGKKLQSISLLSGGEKALTAIALIYAIFKVKPSPFCLLDEVDAALDEANIDRFSKALREFTKKSQFIVITHNKRTITLADVMYGITMEKSGVSKIVSVKFHEESKAKKESIRTTVDETEKQEVGTTEGLS